MADRIPYWVSRPAVRGRVVEAWSGYPLQFAGQRRFRWQDRMATELRAALVELAIEPGEPLTGMHLSTGDARCDAENRLFTSASDAIPKQVKAIRFERGLGHLPEPPVPIERVAGHLYYYKYSSGGGWESWEPAQLLARWRRVSRRLADDGSARPVWLAMKSAAVAGEVETNGQLDDDSPFGPAFLEPLLAVQWRDTNDGESRRFSCRSTGPACSVGVRRLVQGRVEERGRCGRPN